MFQYVIKGRSCLVLHSTGHSTGLFGCYNHRVLDPKVVCMTQQDCDDKEMMDYDLQIEVMTVRSGILSFFLLHLFLGVLSSASFFLCLLLSKYSFVHF